MKASKKKFLMTTTLLIEQRTSSWDGNQKKKKILNLISLNVALIQLRVVADDKKQYHKVLYKFK